MLGIKASGDGVGSDGEDGQEEESKVKLDEFGNIIEDETKIED